MNKFRQLKEQFAAKGPEEFNGKELKEVREILKNITPADVTSADDGKTYIELLNKFRTAIVQNDLLNGDNYPDLLKNILAVGANGIYADDLRFIYELIQNVDDCDFPSPKDRTLDMRFDFNKDEIILTYNEVGFTPFNVFAITGIAEAAKNISSDKNQIGEKGIGFKSVFGVAHKVLIRSGWFSFELHKNAFTVPIPAYAAGMSHCEGTQMTLYVDQGRARKIYNEINAQYLEKDVLLNKNPLLFLNKLTSLKIYFDSFRCMEFYVSRSKLSHQNHIEIEPDVVISAKIRYSENNIDVHTEAEILCRRYTYPVTFSKAACQARYGENTRVGDPNGKPLILQAILPYPDYIQDDLHGSLYSFLPTQLSLTVPLVCHAPFKLDATRQYVDDQNNNLWFSEGIDYLSELLKYAYEDWKTVVKEDIIRYLPAKNANLFAPDNGKERNMRLSCFAGEHYLQLPLIPTADDSYHKAADVICFSPTEKISEPKKVYRLMGLKSPLYLPRSTFSSKELKDHSIKVETDIQKKLFQCALREPALTAEILAYLDSIGYAVSKENIERISSYKLTGEQVKIILQYPKLAKLLRSSSCEWILGYQKNDGMLVRLSTEDLPVCYLKDVLGDIYDKKDTPNKVQSYLEPWREKCICLDIKEEEYLPCHDALILSKKKPLASFANFCQDIDKNDPFSLRVKLRTESENLDRLEDSKDSAKEFLRKLRQIRLNVKEALGSKGYKSYKDLILQSGTDPRRYLQELLQNADDCNYPEGATPSFSITQKGKSLLTECNEVGFSRSNVRSITAIGESTKNSIMKNETSTIGHKGIGFKSIFAVASRVDIYSGEYAFSLTSEEPTIPIIRDESVTKTTKGTKMEILLKDQFRGFEYNEKALLELCLCLRKLRSITIGSYLISIKDSNKQRTITINNNKYYVFKRFTHRFTIINETALAERSNGSRSISPEQTITCFVPEKSAPSDFALYCGLPTKHRMKIPMAIDAPFALITSREQIEEGASAWNAIVRKELYATILEVMDTLKAEERGNIFRFVKFTSGSFGYMNDMSDSNYLKDYDFLSKLKFANVVPTFDRSVFAKPVEHTALLYPEVANILFGSNKYAGILPSSAIDVKTTYKTVLSALGCKQATFKEVFPLLEQHVGRFIQQKDFREKLYDYLKKTPADFKAKVKDLAIIPVYGTERGSVDYIEWQDDSIFIKKDSTVSTTEYFVLAEEQLSKNDCEEIFDANINEMNSDYEDSLYNKRLSEQLRENNYSKLYKLIMKEFRSGALKKHNSTSTIMAARKLILKNEIGELVNYYDSPLFLCDRPSGYFQVEILQKMIVHKECVSLADFILDDSLKNLKNIHYDDIRWDRQLTEDDVEAFLDKDHLDKDHLDKDYFVNSEEILRGFINDGLLSDELIERYALDYLTFARSIKAQSYEYEFPSDPVEDKKQLRTHVQKELRDPIKIVSEQVWETVTMGKKNSGPSFRLESDRNIFRNNTLRIYTPNGAHNVCFCQMCKTQKFHRYIEVNNIEKEPEYFLEYPRLALCLYCSKEFEAMRDNDKVMAKFLTAIKEADIQDQGTIDIPIGDQDTIRFTAKHLAEIQETLLQIAEMKN